METGGFLRFDAGKHGVRLALTALTAEESAPASRGTVAQWFAADRVNGMFPAHCLPKGCSHAASTASGRHGKIAGWKQFGIGCGKARGRSIGIPCRCRLDGERELC